MMSEYRGLRELCKLVVVICLLWNYFSKAAVKEELVIEYLLVNFTVVKRGLR